MVVSDGTLGLPKALQKNLPNAQHQRCITHKVRGIERYLSYGELPQVDPNGVHPTFVKTLVKNSKTLILPLSKMVYLQKWDAPSQWTIAQT